jgi:glycosyltransferase involved in cell wall biosynthesis
MKVLYFHQHFSTPQGSTGTRSYEMARRLISRGHDVTMVCGSYGGGKTGLDHAFRKGVRKGVVDDIEVIEFNLGYSNKDGFMKRIFTFLKFAIASIYVALSQKYDLVFATSTPLTAGIPGIFAKVFRRKSFVFEVRDLWPELPREMGVITNPVVLILMSWLEWCSYHSADACIGLSPGIVRGIKAKNIEDSRVKMIPNGCDLRIFDHDSNLHCPESNAWRPNGVSFDDLMAVFTGTHGIANGLDAIIDGAVELNRRGRTDIKLVFIGDGKLKPALIKRAKSEGLKNCFFLDPVPKAKLSGLLAKADVGIMALANIPAFYYGTSPNKFFDYIASGLPVLNNYPGWLADLIGEYGCGIAVPPDDANKLADCLEEIADDRGKLVNMGQNGKKLARALFDRDELAGQFVDFLESIYP